MSQKKIALCCVSLAAVLCMLGIAFATIPFFPKRTPSPKASPQLSAALSATSSDCEAALKARAELYNPEKFSASPDGQVVSLQKTTTPQPVSYSLDLITEPNERFQGRHPALSAEEMEKLQNEPQICVETRLLSSSLELLAPEGLTLKGGWLIVPPMADQKNSDGKRLTDRLDEIATDSVNVTTMTECYTPVYFRFIEETQASDLVQGFQSDSRTSILQAPKVTFFNNQEAVVQDLSTENFKSGESNLSVHGSPTQQPSVEQMQSGFSVRLKACVNEDESVTLKRFTTMIRSIGNVSQYSTEPDANGTEKTFQLPEISTFCVNLPLTIPKGKMLMVCFPLTIHHEMNPGHMDKNEKNSSEPTFQCVIIRCQVFQPSFAMND